MDKRLIELDWVGKKISISVNIQEKTDQWIFCMHGIQSNKELFDPIFTLPQFQNFSILAFDFVGFGESQKPVNFSYTLEDQLKIATELIKFLHISKFHIIGHSLGGMVGTLMLEKCPSKILSFVNLEGNLIEKDCGASAQSVEFSYQVFQENYYPKIIQKLQNSSLESERKRAQWIKKIPDYVFYNTSKSIVRLSKNEKLLQIFNTSSVKKLFIVGEKNKWKSKVLNKDIAVELISNTGHFMLLEKSDESYEAIINFIE